MPKPTRRPANSGTFYPTSAVELRATIEVLLASARPQPGVRPEAIIAPHSGYAFSGPVAASAYAQVIHERGRVQRVVVVGPAHYVPLDGLALPDIEAFETPLGDVLVDLDAVENLLSLPYVSRSDVPHVQEHSIEVHLPFVQVVLGDVRLVPILAGGARCGEVAAVLDRLWDGDETLVIVSSDLAREADYEGVRRRDEATRAAIEALATDAVAGDAACGWASIAGLLAVARARGLGARALDLRSSGDTFGRREKVVGYGAFAVTSR